MTFSLLPTNFDQALAEVKSLRQQLDQTIEECAKKLNIQGKQLASAQEGCNAHLNNHLKCLEQLAECQEQKDELNQECCRMEIRIAECQERERSLVDKANGYLIENARLTERLAECETKWNDAADCCAKGTALLAECQAREKVLRDALKPMPVWAKSIEHMIDIIDERNGNASGATETIQDYLDSIERTAHQALAIPSDSTALDTMLKTPEGWMLVPIEPTPEMIVASAFDPVCATPSRRHIYRAMILSAPKFKAKELE